MKVIRNKKSGKGNMWFEKQSRIHRERIKEKKKLEERFENMETKLQELYNNQIDPECVYNNLADLEDRSRRCNLRLERITEKKGET